MSTMKRTIITGLLAIPFLAEAQDPAIKNLQVESGNASTKTVSDTAKKKWKAGAIFRVNAGQSSLSNWSGGGDDFSVSINGTANVYACHKKKKFTWDNVLDIGYGFIQSSSLGARKNDDRIDYISKYNYTVNAKTRVGTLVNFRSQMMPGYTYNEKTGARQTVSNFLAPAFALASIGIDHRPDKSLSLFLSPVSSRWVIVLNDTLSARGAFGVDSGHHSINELGAFATINYQKDITKNLSYKTRLDMFSNYRKNPLNVDVYMTNLVSVKVFKMLSFSWNVDLIYDDDTRIFGPEKNAPALQFKSIIGAGLQVKI